MAILAGVRLRMMITTIVGDYCHTSMNSTQLYQFVRHCCEGVGQNACALSVAAFDERRLSMHEHKQLYHCMCFMLVARVAWSIFAIVVHYEYEKLRVHLKELLAQLMLHFQPH